MSAFIGFVTICDHEYPASDLVPPGDPFGDHYCGQTQWWESADEACFSGWAIESTGVNLGGGMWRCLCPIHACDEGVA